MQQQPKTPRERAIDLISLLVTDWRPTPRQGLWAIRIALATIVVLGILTLVGQPFGITLWDWLKLLVVPAVIAAGAAWFNQQQAQENALQAYLDKMIDRLSDLILHEDLLERITPGASPEVRKRLEELDRQQEELQQEISRLLGEPLEHLQQREPQEVLELLQELGQRDPQKVQKMQELAQLREGRDEELQRLKMEMMKPMMVARASTLAVLGRLDRRRKGNVMQFLHETQMIRRMSMVVPGAATDEGAIIPLYGADLSDADLSGLKLGGDNLEDVNFRRANLRGAMLEEAILTGADFTDADLSGADLADARVSQELLNQVKSLEGATMPNGQKY